MSVLPACVTGVWGDQERAVDLLEPELRTIVTHRVGAGNQTRFFERAASASNCWAISSTPERAVFGTTQTEKDLRTDTEWLSVS